MRGCSEGTEKVLPWTTSTYTTDSPETPETFPLMLPALAATEMTNTTIPILKRLRDMNYSSLLKTCFVENLCQVKCGFIHPQILNTQTPGQRPRNSCGTGWLARCWSPANRRSAWAVSGTQMTS